jgi:2-iminoacetate synthase
MSFYDIWKNLEWESLAAEINACTAMDVERALCSPVRGLKEFAAMISPAAAPYLEQMAALAQRSTRQRFGQGVNMYLPLYLTNLCANDCSYCGFSMSNKLKRKVLDEEEARRECEVIRQLGYETLLLVTGEHETKGGMAYFRRMLPVIKPYAAYLMMEVQPLETDEYRELISLGLDGVMVYQETYHAPTYAEHHLRGKKQDMQWRMETPDRLGEAGMDKIGLGALLGLADWRVDSLMVAHHLGYLRKRYWKSRYSLSFPRLRPCTGGFNPAHPMTDRQLIQLICAWRLFDTELELSLSTRESAQFRDVVIPLGITSVSAGSKTQPGGYADPTRELEQFAINDDRSSEHVARAIKDNGLEVIWHEASSRYPDLARLPITG